MWNKMHCKIDNISSGSISRFLKSGDQILLGSLRIILLFSTWTHKHMFSWHEIEAEDTFFTGLMIGLEWGVSNTPD